MAGASFDFHRDIIHDAQFDYYGKLLATASSDRTVRIYAVTSSATGAVSSIPGDSQQTQQQDQQQQTLIKELKGHDGPVWGVAWAHPKFGTILASCSYDRTVIVWQERAPGDWHALYTHQQHSLSVNSVAWGPHELGLCFAAASSDGMISVAEHRAEEQRWDVTRIAHSNSSNNNQNIGNNLLPAGDYSEAHKIGVNAISWGPPFQPTTAHTPNAAGPELVKQLVSAGSDRLVKVWSKTARSEGAVWDCTVLEGHSDWVRDVAWAPNIGVPRETIASCSDDGSVIIWTHSGDSKSEWSKAKLEIPNLAAPSLTSSSSSPTSTSTSSSSPTSLQTVWSVSWSTTGNLLAVASGEDQVSIWKENPDGEWKQVGRLPSTEVQ